MSAKITTAVSVMMSAVPSMLFFRGSIAEAMANGITMLRNEEDVSFGPEKQSRTKRVMSVVAIMLRADLKAKELMIFSARCTSFL